jgi:Nucleotidyl transferase AbiEii toxin, Type IV TA system
VTENSLTPLQVEATRVFFSLGQSVGFVVAGGAALIAQGLIHRPTQDVDLFLIDSTSSTIADAAKSFESAIEQKGWSHQRVIDQQEFIRLLIISRDASLLIDLGRDSPAGEPVESTQLGPTLSPRDLATRKTLALFGRAEARDFSDVFQLARRYGRKRLLRWAAAEDAGFDTEIFAEMLGSIDRLSDDDLRIGAVDVADLRAYFHDWIGELAEFAT